MQFRYSPVQAEGQNGARPARWSPGLRWARVFVCLTLLASLTGIALNGAQSSSPRPITPTLPPAINSAPDPKDQLDMRQAQNKQQNFAAANAERKKQISDDSAKLLKLAADLKTEVDKTARDTLSLNVIRKADEIEKLAHDVKEKMKLTVGQN
ncbi:MAG: hypothetical protein WB608_10915 [Terracidiphilus sp.]